MKSNWWKDAVVYQIYPRSFNDSNGDGIGDLQGIIEKLNYIKKLGVDIIWLSPVYESPNDDNGYDISDYRKIMNEFGTMRDWEEMLAEIHKRDMKLMMDLVVNHTSDEHHWFQEARKSKDNPYRDYYIWRPGKEGREPNNWESVFGGSVWQYDSLTSEYYLHIFSRKQPDLNWENEKVRQEVYEMMKFWLDKGVNGFRMDVINFISKIEGLPDAPNPENKQYVSGEKFFINGPKIHDYLQELHKEVLANYEVVTVGEMPGATVEDALLYTAEDRKEVDMIFTFEHMDLDKQKDGSKWDIKPLKLTDLKENLSKWQKGLQNKGWNSLYWNNHDQPRVVSRFGNDKEYRMESAKMLATCLHMMKGTPYIYQGEEIGMTNVAFHSIDEYKDIETLNMYNEAVRINHPQQVMESIYAKGRDNARTPMQWDDSKNAGFTTGEPWLKVNPNYKEVNVETALKDPNSIFYYYQKLISLRKEHEIIVHGDFSLLYEYDEQIFSYTRTYQNEMLIVMANFSDGETLFELPNTIIYETKQLLIHNYDVREEEKIEVCILRPWEARVYKLIN
ncbi:alpha-glucosidase [Bacillus carboniphilus]|uniref:oligo-1,6-glucosidase n=1 Tax=Bacillus carboniphilus TaxID=86663 RepID=A0ABY9JTL2_9BACI|nr:alpha-glucosidase [Bacillus carboniphilus]WLR42742.1 alpha-glucosidase [Bacillus carboniphilus]